MKKLVPLAVAVAALAAPSALAHQVTPPGLDGDCTTTLHGARAVPAHTLGMVHAAERSPAVSRGFCAG